MRCFTTRRVLRTRSANSVVVAGAQPAGQPERPHLSGLEPIGEEALVVGAVAVEFGEAVVEAVERPGVADADDRDRDERHERDRHEQRRDAQQHQHDHGTPRTPWS